MLFVNKTSIVKFSVILARVIWIFVFQCLNSVTQLLEFNHLVAISLLTKWSAILSLSLII